MSIVQNLKILNKPIAELAMLPQESIIRLAQMGQIPVGFVAPILGEKAEQSKAGAAAAAMMSQKTPQPTVLEKIMAENAVGEVQSQLPESVGIGSLPVSDDSLPKEFAGGGIVAFAAGGDPTMAFLGGQEEQPFMTRKELIERMTLPELQQYNRTGKIPERLREAVGGRFVESGSFIGNLPLTRQPAEFEAVTPPKTPTDLPAAAPAASAAPAAAPAAASATPSEVALVTQEGKKLIPKQGMSIEDFKARQAEFGITDDVDADLRTQIEELAAGSKAEREQAKYMAMLQAGLSIMGGTSPYAFENIAKGAQKGVAQYASDIKDIKKEERDLVKLRGELARAEDARKRGDFKTFQDANDKAQALEISLMNAESTRMTAKAQQRLAESKATGSGITLNQMANLRMKAEKEVDPAAVRAAVAKEKKLSKIPKPGENKKFDAAVDAAYEAEIERRVNRALGGATRSSVGTRADLSGYRIVPEDDE